ncbi:MAG: hypothetical protein GY849_19600, partial [Deltaproteobacteria bacterium]|nr:hypothetical protein [Deltaproteobacteria bacterium]
IRRHESLRTSFHMLDGIPVQTVHPPDSITVTVEHYSPESSSLPTTYYLLPTGFIRPFELSHAPLLRLGIMEQEDGEELLLVDMHHIISDGVSHANVMNEFGALLEGQSLEPLELRYRDYACWEQGALEQGRLKTQNDWWLEQLSGTLPVLNLPLDYPRPPVQSFQGASLG